MKTRNFNRRTRIRCADANTSTPLNTENAEVEWRFVSFVTFCKTGSLSPVRMLATRSSLLATSSP